MAGPDHLALLLAVVISMFMTSLYGSEIHDTTRKTNEPVRFSPVFLISVWDITIWVLYKLRDACGL